MTASLIVRFRLKHKGSVLRGLVAAACLASAPTAHAEQAVSCGGFAMLGGAQINCSHVAPKQPTQFCTFSWSLMTSANTPTVVGGAFIVPPGTVDMTVYQGGGFASALTNPIILCQGKKSR